MKKKLNVDQIQSELRGGSAFFPGYKGNDSPTSESTPFGQAEHQEGDKRTTPDDTDRATGRPPDDQAARPGDRATGKGILVRRGFEFREDQLRALKQLSIQEQLDGKPGSMSQMVRDAIDAYLQQRAAKD